MKRLSAIIILLSASLSNSYCQEIMDIYEQTVKFAELFLYGDRDQDIGLKFAWKYDNGNWKPNGNGFLFLSQGLGIYEYEKEQGINVIDGSSCWVVKSELSDYYSTHFDEYSVFDNSNIISWQTNHENDSLPISMNIVLLDNNQGEKTPVIPTKIIYSEWSDSIKNIQFVALTDTIENDLMFRIVNLESLKLDINIDNHNYPAAPIGWRFLSQATPGTSNVNSSVAALHMNGNITVPPYSFAVFIFPTSKHKYFIPKNFPDVRETQNLLSE